MLNYAIERFAILILLNLPTRLHIGGSIKVKQVSLIPTKNSLVNFLSFQLKKGFDINLQVLTTTCPSLPDPSICPSIPVRCPSSFSQVPVPFRTTPSFLDLVYLMTLIPKKLPNVPLKKDY